MVTTTIDTSEPYTPGTNTLTEPLPPPSLDSETPSKNPPVSPHSTKTSTLAGASDPTLVETGTTPESPNWTYHVPTSPRIPSVDATRLTTFCPTNPETKDHCETLASAVYWCVEGGEKGWDGMV
jgi:hypothetical protein